MLSKKFEPYAKYGGLVTVSFEWLSLLLFYIIQPAAFDGHYPVSYFASLPQTQVIFSVCYFVAASSFWVFTRYHLKNYYHVPVRLFTISMLGFGGMALVPFNPDDLISLLVHNTLAQIFSLTYLAGILITGLRKHNDNEVRLVSVATVALSLMLLIVFLTLPHDSPMLMLSEILSGLVGELWIIFITFHSFKKSKKRDDINATLGK